MRPRNAAPRRPRGSRKPRRESRAVHGTRPERKTSNATGHNPGTNGRKRVARALPSHNKNATVATRAEGIQRPRESGRLLRTPPPGKGIARATRRREPPKGEAMTHEHSAV